MDNTLLAGLVVIKDKDGDTVCVVQPRDIVSITHVNLPGEPKWNSTIEFRIAGDRVSIIKLTATLDEVIKSLSVAVRL